MKTFTVLSVFLASLVASGLTADAFEPSWGNVISVNYQDKLWGDFGHTAWSPDGSTLALCLPLEGIVTVSADGGNATKLHDRENVMILYGGLDYSPDGTKMVFDYREMILTPDNLPPEDLIGLVDIATGAFEQVATGNFPRWSSNGQMVCYVRSENTRVNGVLKVLQSSVLILDMQTRTERVLITKPGSEGIFSCPQFFPDDSAVLYSSIDAEYVNSLFVIPLNGGEPREIKITDVNGKPLEIQGPSIHPNGIHCIANNLDWINLQTGKAIQIAPDTSFGTMGERFSPDGRRISFTRLPHSGQTQRNETCILELDESLLNDIEPVTVESDSPALFPVLANFPNPFNPRTNIAYSVPATGPVSLVIHDVLGRRIRTLVDGIVQAGSHQAVWDGCDEMGNPSANGIYFSRLQAGEIVKTNKMLMMK